MPRVPFLRILWANLAVVAILTTTTHAQNPQSNPDASKSPAAAKQGSVAPSPKGTVDRSSILRLVTNPMMLPLSLCSVVAVGFALERLFALRRSRVIPRDFVARFTERLANGKLDRDRATELCKANESVVARIFAHIMRYWGEPASTIRQALGYDASSELADLKRNVRVLNGTATIAPLLGLLGTVFGMIESFDALGGRSAGSAKGEALAHGISVALGTTAFGLLIAIVSVASYYFLLNRIDVLVRELDEEARRVIDLVAAEEARPVGDRRAGKPGPSDVARQEHRVIGRSEPV